MGIRILLVDDHAVVRQGITSLFATLRPEWTVSEASDGVQARESMKGMEPDLVLMDVTMPDASGLELASCLRGMGYSRPILIFTMHSSTRLATDARTAGAQGYVLKSQGIDEIVRAIDTLLAGGTFFGAPSPAMPPKALDSGL